MRQHAKDWAVWHHKTGWRRRIGIHRLMALPFNSQLAKKCRGLHWVVILALLLCIIAWTMSLFKMLPLSATATPTIINYMELEPQSFGMRLILQDQNAAIASSVREQRYSPSIEVLNFLQETRAHDETFVCDRSSYRTDVCTLKGDVRMDASSSTIFLVSTANASDEQPIRPYTRKWENETMAAVDELSLRRVSRSSSPPACHVIHSVPAVVFSTGGYAGNFFHDFTDVMVPLFITSRHLAGQAVLVVLNHKPWWADKFGEILAQLSRYPPLDFRQDSRIHCFPEATVGLRFHADLYVEAAAAPGGYTMEDFQALLQRAYVDKDSGADDSGGTNLAEAPNRPPKLVIVAREKSRVLVNQKEIVQTARKLGFAVVVLKPDQDTSLKEMYGIINSCDVFMGVHGAALTHFLFLKPGAVFIQIVPLGIEWASRTFFREPAMKMKNIHYLEYQILPRESSLYEEYPEDHPFLRNPKSVNHRGWEETKRVYLDTQNVRMDLLRLHKTLQKSLRLIRPKINHKE